MLPAAALDDPRAARFSELKARFHGRPGSTRVFLDRALSTGIPVLDELLGGGLPLGSLVTLEGPASSGRWSLVASLLAQATRRGLGAVIDDGELYPPTLEAAGVRLDRLLIVPAATPVSVGRVADVLLRSHVARVVVMSASALRAAVWTRLANLAHRAGVVLVVVATRASAELAGVATVRLGCTVERPLIEGTHGLWGRITGMRVRAEVRKHKVPVCVPGRGGVSFASALAPARAAV